LRFAHGEPDATLLLPLDQGEEFLAPDADGSSARLLEIVRDALLRSTREIMAVVTLRSDQLDAWQGHSSIRAAPDHLPLPFEVFSLGPLPMERVPEIVRGPARYTGLRIHDELVDAIRNDTATPDSLPLLAYTLQQLHDRFGADGELTFQEYKELGRLEGSIRTQANAAIKVDQLSRNDLNVLRAAFVPTLVRATESGGFVRSRASRTNQNLQPAEPLVAALLRNRLLKTDREEVSGEETIEIAHEALLRVWPLLAGWLAEDAQKLAALDGLQRAAEAWERSDRKPDYLVHRDQRLADIDTVLAEGRFEREPKQQDKDYLAACRREQASRQRFRRLLQRVAALAVIGLIALSSALFWQWQEAKTQEGLAIESRDVAVNAKMDAEGQRKVAEDALGVARESGRLGALLTSAQSRRMSNDEGEGRRAALVALEAAPTTVLPSLQIPDVFSALRLAMHRPTERMRLLHQNRCNGSPFYGNVDVISDNQLSNIIATLTDFDIRLFNIESGKQYQCIDGVVLGKAISLGIRGIVQVATFSDLRRYSTEDGSLEEPTTAIPQGDRRIFSLDGRYLLAGIGGKGLRLIDTETGTNPIPDIETSNFIAAIAINDDGTLLAYAENLDDGSSVAHVVNRSEGDVVQEWKYDRAVSALAFTHDATRLAVGLGDGRLNIRSVSNSTAASWIDMDGRYLGIQFGPDDLSILAITDNDVRFLYTGSGEQVLPPIRTSGIRSWSLSENADRLTLGFDRRALVMQVPVRVRLARPDEGAPDAPGDGWSPDHTRLFSTWPIGTASIDDFSGNHLLRSINFGSPESYITDGYWSDSGTTAFFNMENGARVAIDLPNTPKIDTDLIKVINGLALCPLNDREREYYGLDTSTVELTDAQCHSCGIWNEEGGYCNKELFNK